MEPDLIVTIAHWGSEYATKPNKFQQEAAEFLFENGVDVILGSHCHVPQPYERRTITTVDGETKDVFVSFCLGNLISAQTYDYTNLSAMLNLEFEMDPLTREVVLTEVSYIPIYTVKASEGSDYHVLPIHDGITSYETDGEPPISSSLYNSLLKGLKDLLSILGPEGDPMYSPPDTQ
jgi:poly-gamma-glutamate synthesis protein (capsule biosynthesis protein)